MNHEDGMSQPAHDPAKIATTFREYFDAVDEVVDSITETEIAARIHQLLGRGDDRPAQATRDLLADVATTSAQTPHMLIDLDVSATYVSGADTTPTTVSDWETTVARVQAELAQAQAAELLEQARRYLETSRDQACEIMETAKRSAAETRSDAQAQLAAAMTQAEQIVADARRMAEMIVADAEQSMRPVTRAAASPIRTPQALTLLKSFLANRLEQAPPTRAFVVVFKSCSTDHEVVEASSVPASVTGWSPRRSDLAIRLDHLRSEVIDMQVKVGEAYQVLDQASRHEGAALQQRSAFRSNLHQTSPAAMGDLGPGGTLAALCSVLSAASGSIEGSNVARILSQSAPGRDCAPPMLMELARIRSAANESGGTLVARRLWVEPASPDEPVDLPLRTGAWEEVTATSNTDSDPTVSVMAAT